MRLAESLSIPAELERARAAGELVVFAGAGVSMGPPANLPGFEELARRIAEPKVAWKRSFKKELDRYLGTAERVGVEVQTRARDILKVPGSHTLLHEYLLALFGTADRVRLITTNFDQHFASAAATVFGGVRIPEYVGPALPPGQHFRGIAQLHGSLDHPEGRLILADSDFAEAYMAEGWAARFLARLFTDRTVLFVGYSLSDPIMRYLLHALPATGRWYALWHYRDVGQGAEHAIRAVPFGRKRQRDQFLDLNEGMRRWGWYARAAPSDHDAELQRLVDLGPPTSPVDADYVRARLATPEGRQLFWASAKQEQWFNWAASEGLLDGLVDHRGRDPNAGQWGQWCLDHFCEGEVPALLRYLRGRPLTLDPIFRRALAWHLWRRRPFPPRPVLRQLIALIIGGANDDDDDRHPVEWLIERLIKEQYFDEALALLRFGTQLRLLPLERLYKFYQDEEDPGELQSLSMRVATRVPSSELVNTLERCGVALATEAATEMLALGERRIEEMYELLGLAHGAKDGTDWLSFGRTAIAPSGQDGMRDADDLLIEITRLALDRLAVADTTRLKAFIARHENNDQAILRRLALYAVAVCRSCSSEEVLKRATDLGWARDVWLRPELYQVLGTHFPGASEGARRAFIEAIRDDQWWGEQFDKSDAHARFSLSVKLLRDVPESSAALEFAQAEKVAHPTWQEQDEDGFLSRLEVGWGSEEPSPIPADELLAQPPEVAHQRIREALAAGTSMGRDHSLLGAVEQAAGTSAEWGIQLFRLGMNGDEVDARIAEVVLFGLRETAVSHDHKLALLAVIANSAWSTKLARTTGFLLDHWARALGRNASPDFLGALERAADRVFERSRTLASAVEEEEGWTERAINHGAGHAAQVWWHVAVARNWAGEQFVLSLSDEEKRRWRQVLDDQTSAGAFARPILGMATDRLSVGDYPWTVEAIFPAFDPERGAEQAAQLWDGRLMQHSYSWSTVEGLRPYFIPMFRRSASLLAARSRELGDFVALLAARCDESGMTLTQLQTFVEHATSEARRAFADALPRHLATLTPKAREQVWRMLLARYWADRRTGMPLALASDELCDMLSWVKALPEVSREVVAELRNTPKVAVESGDMIIYELSQDRTWVQANPDEAASVIGFLAESKSIKPWSADDALELLETALKSGVVKQLALDAAESLVSVSPVRAAALATRLRAEM